MAERIKISGGAGPREAAAIAAVVAAIEEEERVAAAVRPKPILQSEWIRTGLAAKHAAPINPRETATPEHRQQMRTPWAP